MAYATRYLRIMDPLMEGIDVRNVQERLRELGYYQGDITGIYDRKTAETVQGFQKEMYLTDDGIVGPDTWNAIGLSAESSEYFNTQFKVIIDLTKKELTSKENEKILKIYPVGIGKPSTPTPTGNWRIIQKTVNPGGPFGVRWMRLNVSWGGYGIHGTDEPASIGKSISHGCIRLYNSDIIQLYDVIPLGTEVKIIGNTNTGRVLYIGVPPGSDIQRIQLTLKDIGYYTGPIYGVYGESTRDAVIRLQKEYGLLPDGVVGPNTYEVLEKLYDTLHKNDEP